MISIIMSTYNEKIEWLKQAIESIINQDCTYPIEFLIILDNPNNKEIESLVYNYMNKDDRIKVIKNEKNMGLVKSLNKGIEAASGKYIMRMDADDISVPNRIEKELKFLMQNDLDLVAGEIIKIDETNNEIGRDKIKRVTYTQIRNALKIRNILAHPTWFGKSELFKENKGYREIEACEDYDFLLRSIYKNKKIGIIPEYVLKYRVRKNSICNTKQYVQYKNTQIIKKFYNKGKIDDFKQIEEEINKPINIKKEKEHKEVNEYVENFKKMSKTKKITQIPKLIVMFLKNSILRNIIMERIKLLIILEKGK